MYDTLSVRVVRGTIIGILLLVAVVFFLFPIYWITLASFKTKPEILSPVPLHLFQFAPNLDNYLSILGLTSGDTEAGTPGEYVSRLKNSVIIEPSRARQTGMPFRAAASPAASASMRILRSRSSYSVSFCSSSIVICARPAATASGLPESVPAW